MALIDDVKTALRITTDVYDGEISGLIAAARDDLRLSGVASAALDADDPDPLIKRAIILYCKAEFGLDNPEAERYMASFRALETHLALSSEYQETQ